MSRHTVTLAGVLLCGLSAVAAAAAMAAPKAAAPSTSSADHRLVIIDQDAFGPAGSNLQAILMLLQARDVHLLGITVVSGDGWRDEEVDHTLRLLEIAGRPEVPVIPGAVYPLVNSFTRTLAWEKLYGKLFYKGAFTEVWPDQGVARRLPHPTDPFKVPASPAGTPKLKAADDSAAHFLVNEVRKHPHEVSVIAAGPLTDIALAARLDPQFSHLVQQLVIMGGSYNPTPADNPFAAEYVNTPRRAFNFRWDPEAASMVFHEPWTKIVQVPIDPTTRTFFNKELLARVAHGRAPFAGYIEKFGESYPMWDELAVAVWLDPSIATRTQTLAVDVDTSFTASYGNNLSWSMAESPGLGERPVEVVMDIDLAKFEALTLDLLTRPSPR